MSSADSPLIAEPVTEIPGNLGNQSFQPSPKITDPNNPPWGVVVAVFTWLASIALLVFVPVFTALPYMIYRTTTGASSRPESLMADKNFIFFSVLGVIPAHLLTLGLAWLLVTRAGRYPFWKTLGWEWNNMFGIFMSMASAVVLLVIGFMVTYFVGGGKTELDEIINSSYQTRVATAFLAATTGPLVEEIVYRGLLYSALQRIIGVVWTVLIVSFLFAGVHVYQYRGNAGVIAVISLLSLTLTAVRAYTGRLLPSFVIHFVFNGIQSVLLLVQPFFEKPEQMPEKIPSLITNFLRLFT